MKLQSLCLYQFDPIRDFSLETIFYTLPKLSLLAEDEYLMPEWFIEISQQFQLTFPISVRNASTILQSCQHGIWRLNGKKDTYIYIAAVKVVQPPVEKKMFSD